MSTLCVSCLDAPPQFEATQRTAPVVTDALVVPPIGGMITMRSDGSGFDAVDFDVPFQSEDLGERLDARLYLDFTRGQGVQIDSVGVTANSEPFDEQAARAVRYNWHPDSSLAGCHTVTMFLTHIDNFENFTGFIDERLGTIVTWWFYFVEEGAPAPALVSDCPSTQPTAPQ